MPILPASPTMTLDNQDLLDLFADTVVPKKRGPGRPKDEAKAAAKELEKAAAAAAKQEKAAAKAEERAAAAAAREQAKAAAAAAKQEKAAAKAEERAAAKAASVTGSSRGPKKSENPVLVPQDEMITALRIQVASLQGQLAAIKALVC